MLITTHCGMVVNSDHVACIAMQKHLLLEGEPEGSATDGPRFKVLLCLANGMMIVAVRQLSETAARFLRIEIAKRWAEGCAELNVCETLHRHTEGAYYAQDLGTKLILIEGGD